jgi:hypothetical protein
LRLLIDFFNKKKDYEIDDLKGLSIKNNSTKIKLKRIEDSDIHYLPTKKVKKCQQDESYS